MPFRCKCRRTFEKIESFSSHTSGCASFHRQRMLTSDILGSKSGIKADKKAKLTIDTGYSSQQTSAQQQKESMNGRLSFFLVPLFSNDKREAESESNPPRFAPVSSFMMPTALSIQSTFEGVSRRKSMSYKASTMN